MSGSAYDQQFYRELDSTAAISARVVVPLLLFATESAIDAHAGLCELADDGPPRALVHPECFARVARQASPGLGRWLKMGPAAARRALGPRRGGR